MIFFSLGVIFIFFSFSLGYTLFYTLHRQKSSGFFIFFRIFRKSSSIKHLERVPVGIDGVGHLGP